MRRSVMARMIIGNGVRIVSVLYASGESFGRVAIRPVGGRVGVPLGGEVGDLVSGPDGGEVGGPVDGPVGGEEGGPVDGPVGGEEGGA